MRKGQSMIIIIFALMTFTAAIAVLWLSLFAIPGLKGISQREIVIGSNVEKSDIYIYNINQINFLRSAAPDGKTVSELMDSLYKMRGKKDEKAYKEAANGLEAAANSYLSIYDKKCVTFQLKDSSNNVVWEGQRSKACGLALTTGTSIATRANVISPLSKTEILIPIEETEKYLIAIQEVTKIPP